mmetsp:Transcript_18521/g.20729  ORF Transcript_18521/g.20729 Transcript_18521/m.20729 type:complete len:128 (+) Transcript_18521:3542-3925(+)
MHTIPIVTSNAVTSRISAPRQGTPSATRTTMPETTPPTSIAAPVNAPRLSLYPFSSSEVIADMVDETSAAPLPKANKVTPANRGGSPSFKENISKLQEKKSSAVLPNNRKRVIIHRITIGLKTANAA